MITKKASIATYVINLENRKDRKKQVSAEFENRKEFDIVVVKAKEHTIGAMGLWRTVQFILTNLADPSLDYILICEDDHQFTDTYSSDILFRSISEAQKNDADVLMGGISWFNSGIQLRNGLAWIDQFTGAQFLTLFRKFWNTLLHIHFSVNDTLDHKISMITTKKFVITPFMSIQKDYGYSDVTEKNNGEGKVAALFKSSKEGITIINKISQHYQKLNNDNLALTQDFDSVCIPVYAINLARRPDRRLHLLEQFAGRSEFNVSLIEACEHEIGTYGLWLSIRKIVQIAIDNDDDVIIICEDDHQFTKEYSKEYLIKNIIEANEQGVNYLSGGVSNFRYAIKTAQNRYWVSSCLGAQFIILFKSLFKKILDEPFDQTVIADILLPELTSQKMVLFPFISIQKDFGYSDVTQLHMEQQGIVNQLFDTSIATLQRIEAAYQQYESVLLNHK